MPPLRAAPVFPNPSQKLDLARFSNDEMLACFHAERNLLQAATPQVPVTTNLMGLFRPSDAWAWGQHMDLASLDSYPEPADPEVHVGAALLADLTRPPTGEPWYLMEHALGRSTGGQPTPPSPPAGSAPGASGW